MLSTYGNMKLFGECFPQGNINKHVLWPYGEPTTNHGVIPPKSTWRNNEFIKFTFRGWMRDMYRRVSHPQSTIEGLDNNKGFTL